MNANVHAFRKGDAAARFTSALLVAGVPCDTVARVVSRIHFPPHPVAEDVVAAWCQRLLGPSAAQVVQRLCDHDELTRLETHP